MSILNSVVGGLVIGTIKVGGVAARAGVSVAYSLGEAGQHGMRVGELEYDKQVVLTNAAVVKAKASRDANAIRFEAMKQARALALSQAAPAMVVAPVAPTGKAAKA